MSQWHSLHCIAHLQVTAIVYGNPDWKAEHGGQLRIWAPPGSQIARECFERPAEPSNSNVVTFADEIPSLGSTAAGSIPMESGLHAAANMVIRERSDGACVGTQRCLSDKLIVLCFVIAYSRKYYNLSDESIITK